MSLTTSVLHLDIENSLRLPLGNIPGVSHINKYGLNSDVDPGSSPEDIWDPGDLWAPLGTARLHDIVSTSANDTGAGTGAQSIKIFGLDSSYNEQSETLALAGLGTATTANTYIRIYRMYVESAGSILTNEGIITATAQVDLTLQAQISAGIGQTLMAIYTIPAGKTGLLTGQYASMSKPGGGQSATADMVLRTRGPVDIATSAWRVRQFGYLTISGSEQFTYKFNPYKVFDEKTDIVMRCNVTTVQNLRIAGGFDIILIDNSII